MLDFPAKKLGFGLMRLPKAKDGSIDIEHTQRMVDKFLEAGMTYFDTAYVYDDGGSEIAARKALVERYPRDSFTLATKLNTQAAKNAEDARNQIHISLERLGTNYIDFYLLHNINKESAVFYDKYNLWEYMKELKAAGTVRHIGFSFHDTADLLDELLAAHPEVEFVQLQVNYADWNDSDVQSAANIAVCEKYGLPAVVMEPVKGGSLAAPPEPIASVFRGASSELSPSSWAIRFAASQKQVSMVLSGMSNIEQMEDNLSSMTDFVPLNSAEMEVIERAQEALGEIDQIKCTGCNYCTKGCPQHIPIPAIFTAMNRYKAWNNLRSAKFKYKHETTEKGLPLASACIACGQCESACPQHLPIIDYLQETALVLE